MKLDTQEKTKQVGYLEQLKKREKEGEGGDRLLL